MSEQAKLHQNSQTLSLSFESSLIQSCMRLADPDELVLDYTRAMMGFLLFNPAPRSVLMIGLGGGALHKYIHKHLPETDLTTVEINPGVIELRQDFCIPPDDERSRIVCADGAAFLAKPTHQFDVILVDGFTGDGIPDALCSPGFYRRVKAALTPQGVMVANVQADTEQTRDIMKRVGRVFDGATLWGAETAGYAVPINFLLQIEHIAALLEASDSRILVALGPHPVLDIWQKALALRERLPGLTLIRVAPPGTPAVEGVIDFHTALAAQPEDHLVFGEPGKDDDVAAYFHTGGTTGTPKLVAHTHRGQLTAAFGGAAMGNYRSDDVFTGTFPLFHVAGTIACGLGVFLAGMELLVMSPGGLRTPAMVQGFWRLVAQYKATLVGGVPTSMGAVLEVPLDGADISAVRAGITGAALGLPGLNGMLRYVSGDNVAVAGGNGGKEWERDFDLSYVIQSGPLKNVSVRLRNATFRSSGGLTSDEQALALARQLVAA